MGSLVEDFLIENIFCQFVQSIRSNNRRKTWTHAVLQFKVNEKVWQKIGLLGANLKGNLEEVSIKTPP